MATVSFCFRCLYCSMLFEVLYLLQLIFIFPFVSNSLAYITIPKTMEKGKLSEIKNLLQHICVFFLLYNPPLILNLNKSLLNLNTASFDDDDDDDDDNGSLYTRA